MRAMKPPKAMLARGSNLLRGHVVPAQVLQMLYAVKAVLCHCTVNYGGVLNGISFVELNDVVTELPGCKEHLICSAMAWLLVFQIEKH